MRLFSDERVHVWFLAAAWSVVMVGCTPVSREGVRTKAELPPGASTGWWKGNVHTHSCWSDGNQYPEMVADWYKQHGYHFLVMTDHDIVPKESRWVEPEKLEGGVAALAKYRGRFGDRCVDERLEKGTLSVRLNPLAVFRSVFEEPGRFCLIQGEEISAHFRGDPVHVCAINVCDLIKPQEGKTMVDTIEKNVHAVQAQRDSTGQPMFAQVNHPNYGMTMTAEDIARAKSVRFFEVYNGHPTVRNYGDDLHTATERIWDIVLTLRLADGTGQVIYGVASDDAHDFLEFAPLNENPGRGWVMVHADRLSPESIVAAMERGNFYASTGARLRDLGYDGKQLRIQVEAEPGVTYTTQFIGTRKGFDPGSEPVTAEDKSGKPVDGTRRYSKDVGQVLAIVKGTSPSYTLKGNEIYVRAKVISSKGKATPQIKGETECAWTQPIVPGTTRP